MIRFQRYRVLLVLVASLLTETDVHAKDRSTVTETRQHFQVRMNDGTVLYDVTEVVRVGTATDQNHLLVHDRGHGHFVMRREWSFADQTVTYRISDVQDRTYIQHSYKTPFSSKTRLDTLAEARRDRVLLEMPAVVKLESNGGAWEGMDKDWDEYGRLREVRHNVRQTVDTFLLEAVERMRGTLFDTPPAAAFHQQLGRFILYDPHNDANEAAMAVVDAQPDCDFDQSFGYDCSKKQGDTVRAAAKSGKPLTRY